MGPTFISGKVSRRKAIKGGLGTLGMAALGLGGISEAKAQSASTDTNVLNFALNLEYLEAEFYTYATTGQGLTQQGIDVTGLGTPGEVIVKQNARVRFNNAVIEQYALEIAENERDHVRFLRSVLPRIGGQPIARPTIDLLNSFNAVGRAAGLVAAGQPFDPFASELNFLLMAFLFEDLGVTAYRGATPLIINKTVLSSAAGILGTEAYQAGNIRTTLFQFSLQARQSAQQISDLRDALDGGAEKDQGLVLDGQANIVPTNPNALVFTRSMKEVLNILYLAPGVTKGGFFPNGIN